MALGFPGTFESLTGERPMSWQTRLYEKHFLNGELPSLIDIPTGLGKTMVMAIWLIARMQRGIQIPTRLVYVVDRRTVVDQATDLAKKLQENYGKLHENNRKEKIAISTLRGQLADNREWSADPSRPAIIIGTVDLIGSGLLFSGYRSSFKRRPLEAGLLGQDSLLVLDEAHLSKPFEKLIISIGDFQKSHGRPMCVMRMSATSDKITKRKVFRLDTDPRSATFDLWSKIENGKETNPIKQRFEATKRLVVKASANAVETIAVEAGNIATVNPGSRIVIFVKTPKEVEAVRKVLIKKDKSREAKIAQLTGTMRGLERDELVDLEKPIQEDQHKRRVMRRFLLPENDLSQGECFLISTSAGEVGFDLNADHLIGGPAPLDSWIQRLGRVNRRGNGDAVVILVKETEPSDKTDFDMACKAASELLIDGKMVSPQALAEFKSSLTSEQIEAASTPKPTMIELTDILLDAWSMTSITESMPGRPDVAPWLRGIADELPQTTIAWRAELELLADDADRESKLKAIFATHRVRPHESLTTTSNRVVEFLQKLTRDKGGRPELKQEPVVVKLAHDLLVKTIGELIDDPRILNAQPTLILPGTLGGLDQGMLSHEALAASLTADSPSPGSLDVADLDGYEARENVATRWRIVLERAENRWVPKPLPFGKPQLTPISETLGLGTEPCRRGDITDALRSIGLRIRHVIKFDFDEEGDPRKLLLLLSGISPKAKRESQTLADHVGAVEVEATRIANDLQLDDADPVRQALVFAARWHDDGKRAPVWQRFINGPEEDGNPRAKSKKYCDPKKLGGYRHEFGSILRIVQPDPSETWEKPALPIDDHIRDLALHLIAVHHGHGRPHFDNPIDRDFHNPDVIDSTHTESIRRFARLQRKYGWWYLAWLENLLRCADGLASAQVNDDDYQDDEPEAGE